MALAHCILGKFLGGGCHCFPPPLDVPTFSARYLHIQRRERPLAAEGGTLRGREMFRQIPSRIRLPRNSRDLLHAANLRHGTDEKLILYNKVLWQIGTCSIFLSYIFRSFSSVGVLLSIFEILLLKA
jgi:hypothetical protein